jgi:hypothetical protein
MRSNDQVCACARHNREGFLNLRSSELSVWCARIAAFRIATTIRPVKSSLRCARMLVFPLANRVSFDQPEGIPEAKEASVMVWLVYLRRSSPLKLFSAGLP